MSTPENRCPTAPLPQLPLTPVTEPCPRMVPYHLRILVVDDEPALGSAIRRLFRQNEVTAVVSAAEALALLEAGETFDVVICDSLTPVMGGLALHERVRSTWPDLAERFVFLTGASAAGAPELVATELPVLGKPFATDELRDIVFEVARGR